MDNYEKIVEKSLKSNGVSNIKINGETYVNHNFKLSKFYKTACAVIIGTSLALANHSVANMDSNTMAVNLARNIESTFTDAGEMIVDGTKELFSNMEGTMAGNAINDIFSTFTDAGETVERHMNR